MSLSDDLKKLEQKKRDEIRTLHTTYLRTKRQIIRTASPERLVRRNMGISLGIAATLGLLLAPRPTPAVASPKEAKRSRKSSSRFAWATKMAKRYFPQVASFLPDTAPEPPHEEVHDVHQEVEVPRSGKTAAKVKSNRLFDTLLTLVLSKIDLQKIIGQLMEQVMAKFKGGAPHEDGQPHVSVADAGTIRPDNYDDFQ